MLLKDLIEQLKKLPQDSKVMLSFCGQFDPDQTNRSVVEVESNILNENDLNFIDDPGYNVGDTVVIIK